MSAWNARGAIVARWEALGHAGITVSVCYGPCGLSWAWSVQALAPDGQEFEMPFAANDLDHAIEITELEARKRGWVTPNA